MGELKGFLSKVVPIYALEVASCVYLSYGDRVAKLKALKAILKIVLRAFLID